MNDGYKNLFQGLMWLLVVVLALLVLSIMFPSCKSVSRSSGSATATAQAVTVAEREAASVEQRRIDRALTISLDDLELVAWPAGGMAQTPGSDSVASASDSACLPDRRASPRDPVPGSVRLKAKRAVIAQAEATQSSRATATHEQDSTRNTATAQTQAEQAREVTAVAQPVPPWALVVAMVVGGMVMAWIRKKG